MGLALSGTTTDLFAPMFFRMLDTISSRFQKMAATLSSLIKELLMMLYQKKSKKSGQNIFQLIQMEALYIRWCMTIGFLAEGPSGSISE